jgi:hypothetical protein
MTVMTSDVQMNDPDQRAVRAAANRRTGFVLASIVAVFFFGIIVKYWLLR